MSTPAALRPARPASVSPWADFYGPPVHSIAPEVKVDGVILDAEFSDHGWSAPVITGRIWCDAKHRFRNGQYIHTSAILEELSDGVYRTRNSVYRVVFKKENARVYS
ncbi:MAG: hypothetical protein ACAH27_05600 [Xanthobacteraceae bacterium]